MTIDTIAILMPGNMGHSVGRALVAHGHRVITCLAGRSARTRSLAETAGLHDMPDLETLLGETDLVLSILPPSRALELAQRVAEAMGRIDWGRADRRPVYVDCNAVSPDTARAAGDAITAAGAGFIDAGIIGSPPGRDVPRFYVSGTDTSAMESLDGSGFRVLPLGSEVGRASGIKMCYAGLTKGTWTLQTSVLLAAEAMGLSVMLREELQSSQVAAYAAMEQMIPRIPADSERWIGEMEQIADTFKAAGVPDHFHRGAAAVFALIARTPLAAETRETMDTSRSLEDSIRIYAQFLQ